MEIEVDILFVVCAEKYWRTYDEFINTPREIIELLMSKREADAMENKK